MPAIDDIELYHHRLANFKCGINFVPSDEPASLEKTNTYVPTGDKNDNRWVTSGKRVFAGDLLHLGSFGRSL